MADLVTTNDAPKLEKHPQERHIDIGRILIYVVLIIGAIVAIVPFLLTVSVSLMNLSESGGRVLLPSTPQWGNYARAWRDANFGEYFLNSVQIAAITVIGQVVFCTLAAYAFARMSFPGKDFLFALLLSTLILPEAITWVPNFITVVWLGRVTPISWINNWPSLTIPFMASAFSILLLRQFFQQIPNELWDSAQIDGAGHLRYLVRVMLPLSKAPVMTLALFAFIGSWNSLAWPILVGRPAVIERRIERLGLRLRAVGENPKAVDTAGISVVRLRYQAIIITGLLCGLAGAYFSIAQGSGFGNNMTAGKGYIALAALIFAKWKPVPAMFTCLLFGFLDALQIRLQSAELFGIEVPVQAIQALPYVLTVVLLAGFIGKAVGPKAGGVPYTKER